MPPRDHPLIVLFAKAPQPGLAKTRLAAEVGEEEAMWLYRLLVERQLRAIPAGWPMEIHYAPRNAGPEMRAWLGGHHAYVPQSAGDLGERLQSAFAHSFAADARAVIAIGSDCPELNAGDFLQAEEVLQRKDAVVGPARDGGYYLIGLRRPAPQLFADVPWSTAQVFATTISHLENAGLSYELLGVKDDIDDVASMRRVARHLDVAEPPRRARQTNTAS
ncbi:MAG TPA: TIGR04282 family arsenosugar biosynthesis glycosyltransferase [Opitutaceae bacterium]